ncbi:MAG: bifunctional (p)ppGpp synthetase/guanosine-3',5'-bis(diphosphate) 3'-pyrophosphohydrolase [Microscillaceae bacterium]|nr:bifunctional (p)ppGpp synthetase/guanosine-3',5'-bis(diphosphate) 3'-pyrophosphohydrolase [Microscillaceae bacterium]
MELLNAEEEKKLILREYRKLRRTIRPLLKEGDAKLIRKAFSVAQEGHKEMRRKSGEPYILHPLAVAQIVVEEINLGPTAVASALLHDVVEDTEWSLEDIEREFGPKIAQIVDGVTKIKSSGHYDLDLGVSDQAENFRKMILALSNDVRVVLIKLADRLHNMRTLGSMERNKQLKIASETIFIYAPLAHRLGLYKIKTELEDLYLKHSRHDVYREIAEKLQKTKAQRTKFINEFIAPIQEALEKAGFNARVFGRPKSIYSIWNKMQKQNIPFEQIYDLFAIRIVVNAKGKNEKPDCWRIYSLVTDFYKPNPDRLRDWISTPKANGYESLHTTVMGPEGKWVEVQIRTKRMDEIAENGYAAHWKYKEQVTQQNGKALYKESGLDTWVRTLRELREQNKDLSATEFISAFRDNFFNEEVFVFTPKGDLKSLPNGATVLDFAFDIHTEIGTHCLGAKVNQKLVPLSYKLKNGDQIEILTSKQAKPSADWLRFVVTTRARSKIKEFIQSQKKEYILKGKEIVQVKFKKAQLELSDNTKNELKIALGFKDLSNMFYDIGRGYINNKQLNKFIQWKKERLRRLEVRNTPEAKAKIRDEVFPPKIQANDLSKIDTLVIGEEGMLDYSLAKCCNPIPGNDVFGFITINEGIKVHRIDCPNAVEMMSNYGYRVIKTVWQSQKELLFQVELKIIGSDRIGLVRDVTQVISSDMKVNISSIDVGITDEGIFEGTIKLFVRNTNHLDTLMEKIKNIEGVENVNRFDHND